MSAKAAEVSLINEITAASLCGPQDPQMVQMASKRAVRGEGLGGEREEGCGEGVERRVGGGGEKRRSV